LDITNSSIVPHYTRFLPADGLLARRPLWRRRQKAVEPSRVAIGVIGKLF